MKDFIMHVRNNKVIQTFSVKGEGSEAGVVTKENWSILLISNKFF